MNADPSIVFRPRPGFRILYLAPLLLMILFVIDALWRPNRESWLILGITAVVAILAVPRALARVTLEDDRLTQSIPLQRPKTIHLRQLISYENTGRRWNALILRYHPMDEQGRLDIANQEFLGLVPLDEQYLLEDRLREVVGKD